MLSKPSKVRELSLGVVYACLLIFGVHNLVRYVLLQQRYKGTGYKLLLFYVFSLVLFVYKLYLLVHYYPDLHPLDHTHVVQAGIVFYILVFSSYILLLSDLKAFLTVMVS